MKAKKGEEGERREDERKKWLDVIAIFFFSVTIVLSFDLLHKKKLEILGEGDAKRALKGVFFFLLLFNHRLEKLACY